MSNENTTPIVEETVEETVEAAVPAVKTKKELRKERKEIKKHKKQVKKEARMHSSKMTRFNQFLISFLSLVVIVALIVCSVATVKITMNIANGVTPEASDSEQSDTPVANQGSQQSSTPSNDASTPSDSADNSADAPADNSESTDGAEGSDEGADAPAAGDMSTKEGVVEYFKTAHAKVLSEAKSVTRTYDNTTNYKGYLEVGGNDSLASVAQQLMGMFMKENTEALNYTGADIAANFPPTNNSYAGLTADMIGEYSCKEEGDNYVITLTLNSTEENPDLGDNAAHMVSVVQSKQVEDAAAGFVSFTGLRNEYIAPTVTATINKTTGQMTDLHTVVPSYMKFDSATVMFVITVDNVGIGLQYEQKWTVEW